MGRALGLIPTASRVLVDISVCRRVLVAICSLSDGTAIAVRARCGSTLATIRSLYGSCRSVCGGLMLGVRGVAVLGDDRASVAPVSVGGLMCGGIRSRVWVVRLADGLVAIGR